MLRYRFVAVGSFQYVHVLWSFIECVISCDIGSTHSPLASIQNVFNSLHALEVYLQIGVSDCAHYNIAGVRGSDTIRLVTSVALGAYVESAKVPCMLCPHVGLVLANATPHSEYMHPSANSYVHPSSAGDTDGFDCRIVIL